MAGQSEVAPRPEPRVAWLHLRVRKTTKVRIERLAKRLRVPAAELHRRWIAEGLDRDEAR